jgi:hypothetical protein
MRVRNVEWPKLEECFTTLALSVGTVIHVNEQRCLVKAQTFTGVELSLSASQETSDVLVIYCQFYQRFKSIAQERAMNAYIRAFITSMMKVL